MKRRIFWSICVSSFITLTLTAALVMSILYESSAKDMKSALKSQALYIGKSIEMSNDNYLNYVNSIGQESENRITIIASDGDVIYDNFADETSMENHLNRPEISQALSNGFGSDTRLSNTLGEKTYYYAIALDNGTILRVANTSESVFGVVKDAMVWVVIIGIIIFIVAMIVARTLTKSIISPINKLNLDNPLSNDTYDELSPLLNKLEKQNGKISKQLVLLSNQQKEFDYITSTMKDGLVIFGDNGVILSANNSAKKILGNENANSYLELFRDIYYISVVESALSGKSSSTKISINGKTYQLSANSVEGKDQSYAAVLFIIDITEKQQAETMRREFSANVSHELKTPLTSIMGYAEIIENGIAKAEDIQKFAKQINSEASRLLTLIEDIIKLSRLDESALKEEFGNVDLFNTCEKVSTELESKAKKSNISISVDGKPTIIKGVESILHEMIFNLCDNAITYNNNGGTVIVTLTEEADKSVLTVKDNGIGIPIEHQARIFERFYRVDKSHSKETGGTGLGLSIVKHAALLHNADIELESKVGEGTTIKCIFPCV